jgi:hypothetical protein
MIAFSDAKVRLSKLCSQFSRFNGAIDVACNREPNVNFD